MCHKNFHDIQHPREKQLCEKFLITMTWGTDYHIYIYDFEFTFSPLEDGSDKT